VTGNVEVENRERGRTHGSSRCMIRPSTINTVRLACSSHSFSESAVVIVGAMAVVLQGCRKIAVRLTLGCGSNDAHVGRDAAAA
jgi:hypothetical protein